MARGRFLLGGIVIIAVIVIAYFALVYQPPSKDDTTGAIGTANKYRSEQITEQDVVLAGEETEAAQYRLTDEEAAALFERAAPALRVECLKRSPDFEKAEVFKKFTPAEVAALFKSIPAQARVDAFARLGRPAQEEIARSANFTLDEFGRAPVPAAAEMLLRAPEAACERIFAQATAQEKASFIALAPAERQVAALSRCEFEQKARILHRVTPGEFAAVLKNCTADEKAVIFKRFTPHEKAQAFQDMPALEKTEFMKRWPDAELAKAWKAATPQERVGYFESLAASDKKAYLAKFDVTMEAWTKIPVHEKLRFMSERLAEVDQARIIKGVDAGRVAPVLARVDIAQQAKFMDMASVAERASAVTAMPAERVAFVAARSARPIDECLGRLPEKEIEALMKSVSVQEKSTKFFGATTPQEQVAMFERLPAPKQEEILARGGNTMQAFKALPLKERSDFIARQTSMEEKASFIDQSSLQERANFAKRLDMTAQRDFVSRVSLDGKADFVVARASDMSQAFMFQRATKDLRSDILLAYASQPEQAALLARVPVAVYAAMLKNATMAEKSRFYMAAKGDVRIALFDRCDAAARQAFCGRVGIPVDQWGRTPAPAKQEALARASEVEMAGMVDFATVQERAEMFKALPDQAKTDIVKAAPLEVRDAMMAAVNFQEMRSLMGRVSPEKANEMFSRSWAIQARWANQGMERSGAALQERGAVPQKEQ